MPGFSHGERGDAGMQALEAGTRTTAGRHSDGAGLVYSSYSSSVESPNVIKVPLRKMYASSMVALGKSVGAKNRCLFEEVYSDLDPVSSREMVIVF